MHGSADIVKTLRTIAVGSGIRTKASPAYSRNAVSSKHIKMVYKCYTKPVRISILSSVSRSGLTEDSLTEVHCYLLCEAVHDAAW